MNACRTLIIHPSLAPYRIDLFNRLAARLEMEVVFQQSQVFYDRSFNQESLRKLLKCRFSDLVGNISVCNRDIPWGIPALIRDRGPQVVVTSEFSLATIFVIVSRKLRRIRCAHVIWSDENPHTLARHGRIRHWLRRFCSRRVDALIMCSPGVSEAFARRYKLDPDSISVCAVHQAPESVRARLLAAVTIANQKMTAHNLAGKKIVMFVGRLTKVKNLPLAIQAFAQAFEKDDSTVFVFVGTGEERNSLMRFGENLKVHERLRFVGHHEQHELYAWYRIASILILPSTYDPYGAVVNEALICGLHVICSDHAGAARLIREGKNGCTFPPHSVGELTNRFHRLAPVLCKAESLLNRDRCDLMPVSFEEDVNGFLSAIGRASANR